MAKIYRTAQGRQLDIETIRLQNELVPALGNMKVNARGDQLGPGGKVVKSREQIMDEFYKTGRTQVTDNVPEDGKVATSSVKRAPAPTIPSRSKPIESEFKAGAVAPDEPASGKAAEVETDLKGGLAAAVARSKAKEKKVKRL